MTDREYEKENKSRRIKAALKLAALLAIIVAVPLYLYFFNHDLITYFSNIKRLEQWLLNYKAAGMLIYIGAQVLQIIICIIPGQALQFAAGYVWGFLIGLVLSICGAIMGTVFVYYIARLLGHDALHLLFGQKKITDAIDKLNSKNGLILTFLVFLLPGVPKDLFTYAAGLSNLKLRPFLI
ncbi:MAG: VTT domain-containing protein, partial [Bacillota bacterium]|nr:VTT domain-containing protein [Bacillota bacterium]